jgi:hypothetical protein
MAPDEQARLDAVANEVLTLIEGRELRSLDWGFTDVKLDLESELPVMLEQLDDRFRSTWDILAAGGMNEKFIIENLIERKLLFQSDQYYRTRFAETVRLLALLRQRFSFEDWNSASSLVGDYRLFVERRSYPIRDIPLDELLSEFSEIHQDERRAEAIRALVHPEGSDPLTLARFQKEAILRITRNLKSWQERGVVIGAGTGAGKTKAFYIPAMVDIASLLSDRRTTQTIALYPRNELLKDQLVEALTEARKLDEFLSHRETRSISIGAFYGLTPKNSRYVLNGWVDAWTLNRTHDGWECPSIRCPNDTCGREALIWRRTDVEQEVHANRRNAYGNHEVLWCPDCGYLTPPGTIQLTRESMKRNPPDILFTTTEMLNRQLANPEMHTLFGIGTGAPPRFLLLDEIHTYAGVHGAQVAYLLRRWRHGRKSKRDSPLCVVGLSATLTQAERFFSELTGLPEHVITYIAPQSADMIREGAEYNLVLKGDPASSAALLSTSVQTTMLLARMLDRMPRPGGSGISRNALGQKIFAFSDNLDTINRWYHVELDAEQESKNAPLSKYREPQDAWPLDERERRNAAGQAWWASKELEHDLNTGLKLERTSSQDRGVNRSAQLVIATSTLEVGFNDPTVGAVVQHKAPRNMASFLQRKGRAGRIRSMRPWTVVVTSGFGRDRWAFQHAEQLFQPTLPPINLPLDNDYVRKIQASYALMDWLALTVNRNVWGLLTNDPAKTNNDGLDRSRLLRVLDAVLRGVGKERDQFITYLAGALALDPSGREMDGILWQDPRSLMFDVIPTVVRQLRTNWATIDSGERSDSPSRHPLPDYVPENLFSDLNLPQLEIGIPEVRFQKGGRRPAMTEYMPLADGMRNFAPGHASKRFTARNAQHLAHWLPENPPSNTRDKTLFELAGSGIHTNSEPVYTLQDSVKGEIGVYRPRSVQLAEIPRGIEPTSTGRLNWVAKLIGRDLSADDNASARLEMRESSPLSEFIESIDYFLHDQNQWASVIRYAPTVDVVRREKRQKPRAWSLSFQREGRPAAIGFSIDTDAIRFRLRPVDAASIMGRESWTEVYRGLASNFFGDLLRADETLKDEALNTFDIEWLWQIELAALTATAVARHVSLEEAAAELDHSRMAFVTRTMKTIFQAQKTEAGEEIEEYGRRFDDILELEGRPAIIRVLQTHRTVLWDDTHADLSRWLAQRHASSIASVIYAAVTRFVPNIDPDDLLFDLDNGDVWLSEAVPGGVGIVSQVVREIHNQPRQFDLAFIDTIQFCERENLASQLDRVSTLLQDPSHGLVEIFDRVRSGGDIRAIDLLKQELSGELEEYGVSANRSLLVALNTKYLRPNSGPDSDEIIAELVQIWNDEEERLGIEFDLRTMAVVAIQIPSLEDRIQHLLQRIDPPSVMTSSSSFTENLIFNLLQSLLWEGCHDNCPECIRVSHAFFDPGFVSRRLIRAQLDLSFTQIRYGSGGWKEEVREYLRRFLEVRVTCGPDERDACASDLLEALVEPIDLDYQLTYASVQGVSRDGPRWVLHVVVPDLVSQ